MSCVILHMHAGIQLLCTWTIQSNTYVYIIANGTYVIDYTLSRKLCKSR